MKLWQQIIPSELGAVKRTKVIEASGFGVYIFPSFVRRGGRDSGRGGKSEATCAVSDPVCGTKVGIAEIY